jgi:hypothetical protein
MRELILVFHGLGEAHHRVVPEELPYWLSVASFARLLEQVLELRNTIDTRIIITFDDGNANEAAPQTDEMYSGIRDRDRLTGLSGSG